MTRELPHPPRRYLRVSLFALTLSLAAACTSDEPAPPNLLVASSKSEFSIRSTTYCWSGDADAECSDGSLDFSKQIQTEQGEGIVLRWDGGTLNFSIHRPGEHAVAVQSGHVPNDGAIAAGLPPGDYDVIIRGRDDEQGTAAFTFSWHVR